MKKKENEEKNNLMKMRRYQNVYYVKQIIGIAKEITAKNIVN